MGRPVSIINFERSFWASILIGVVSTVLQWSMMRELVEKDPVLSQSADAAVIGIGFAVALSFAFGGLLWYLISRRASNVAKWIYVVLMGFGIVSSFTTMNDPLSPKGLAFALSLAGAGLTALSIYFLFRKDARAWFAGKNVDPRIFE
ncbi:hypothetical protein L7H23_02475 [Sphingopyxis sp. BSN-002]|uniref:hypothetical protein n=1 Tax=Sphingopyxis sp. BSN-002 TaxID=2911495 RepID=UPI001EDB1F98|nr:hypothetical protein [Sphingopyxis sp. BSN-002]UKK84992.1 hypothetical protein L7H23_02475 [Sphingopyxis sp. BSN-002]